MRHSSGRSPRIWKYWTNAPARRGLCPPDTRACAAGTPARGAAGFRPAPAPTRGAARLRPAPAPTRGAAGLRPAPAPARGAARLRPAPAPTRGALGACPQTPRCLRISTSPAGGTGAGYTANPNCPAGQSARTIAHSQHSMVRQLLIQIETLLKAINTSAGIDQLLLTGEERMAL